MHECQVERVLMVNGSRFSGGRTVGPTLYVKNYHILHGFSGFNGQVLFYSVRT